MDIYQTGNIRLAALLLLSITMLSCSKDLDAPTPTPLETGTLSASRSEVVVDMTRPDDEAIKFAWSTDKNTLVSYTLIFTAGPKTCRVEAGANIVDKGFSNSALNAILLDQLALEPGKPTTVSVQAHGQVTINDNQADSNIITISATPAVK